MYMWLLCIKTQPLLGLYARVVLAGLAKDDEDSEAYPVYVGRYEHEQLYSPAKIVGSVHDSEQGMELVEAQVPLNGTVLVVKENFEILVLLENGKATWEPLDSEVDLPEHALPVGETKTGEELFFGRINDFPFNGTTCVGKIHVSQRRFFYPHKDGDERYLDIADLGGSLEILTLTNTEDQSPNIIHDSCISNHSTVSIKHKL